MQRDRLPLVEGARIGGDLRGTSGTGLLLEKPQI